MTAAPSFSTRPWLWGPVLAQMAIIFVASSIPNVHEPPVGTPDWLGHGVGYAILAALLLRALAGADRRQVSAATAATAVALCVLYGVSDEWHQSFVPGRSPGATDLAADALGAAVAVGLGWVWASRRV